MVYENAVKFINSADDGELGVFETNLTIEQVKDLRDTYQKENEEDYNWEDFEEYIEDYGEWRIDFTDEVSF